MAECTSNGALPDLNKILENRPLYLDEAVDTHEAARITGFSITTLETLRSRGGGPPFIKCRRKVAYTRRALLEWLKAGERTSTSDLGSRAA